jgi:hypothetical protein
MNNINRINEQMDALVKQQNEKVDQLDHQLYMAQEELENLIDAQTDLHLHGSDQFIEDGDYGDININTYNLIHEYEIVKDNVWNGFE